MGLVENIKKAWEEGQMKGILESASKKAPQSGTGFYFGGFGGPEIQAQVSEYLEGLRPNLILAQTLTRHSESIKSPRGYLGIVFQLAYNFYGL